MQILQGDDMLKVCCLFLLVIFAGALVAEEPPKKILLITLPKSGTHLLRKALFLITNHRTHWIGLQTKRFDPSQDLRSPHFITGAHLFPLFDQIRTRYIDQYATVLLIRDPRDIMHSFAGHLRRALTWTSCPTFDYARYVMLSSEEQLQEALLFPEKYLNPAICFPYVLLWMKEPSVFVCRFEDLVGSRGGGSDERQREVLIALANHIGYPRTPEEIQSIADQLFGGTWTFHAGQIGKWKESYSEQNLQLFNHLYGRYPIDWGY